MLSKRHRESRRRASQPMAMRALALLGLCVAACDAPPAPEPVETSVDTRTPLSEAPPLVIAPLPVEVDPACLETRYYYCPPLDEIWQAEVTLNTCTDEVVHVGECEEVFECNPTVFDLGRRPCETDDGA
ncbi:MAG: hypothetical protein QF464_13305, partial [Myxococcota bacterium]|nr:hypothetical protein [Myxococcota bacterium]